MKLAIITDTHTGCRSSSSIFRDYMKWYYENVLFKYMEENGITALLHGGDFFDNRNAITLHDIDFVAVWFANELERRKIDMHVIVGNHDVAFKNTNAIHSLTILERSAPKNVTVYTEPKLVELGDKKIAMVPWINSSNHQQTLDFIEKIEDKEDTLILGHFEIVGAKMYAKSMRADHGLEPIAFKDFERVLSGHFHHMSNIQNIFYLGSTFHLTWQDHGDPRGFHVYDTETREFEFIENEFSLFVEVPFDEETFKQFTDQDYKDSFEHRFVRLLVTDPSYDRVALLDTVSKIIRASPHDLQVQNDALVGVSNEPEKESEEEAVEKTSKTTQEYIASYVGERYKEGDKKGETLMKVLDRLYLNAQQLQSKGE